MDLTAEQKTTLGEWVGQGMSLAEVQRRLAADFGLNLTFMDVRFLIDDLDLEVKDAPERNREQDITKAKATPPADAELVDDDAAAPGAVRVEVDKVQRPGAMVSGSVTFSDGKQMGWQLDQMGRLGLIPGVDKDYRPSEDDVAEFQIALQQELQKQGF